MSMKQPTQPFPATIYEFAREQDLGIPLTEHRWGFSRLEALVMPIVGGWLILGILLLLPTTVGLILSNTYPYNLSSSFATLIVLIPSSWYFIECFHRRSSWCVYVFTDGFAYFQGRNRIVFLWKEVRHIKEQQTYTNWSSRPSFYAYWIERDDGFRILLNYHLRDIYLLGSMIKQQVAIVRQSATRRG
jgi:hypothetical protein